jgi:hypothetical protein
MSVLETTTMLSEHQSPNPGTSGPVGYEPSEQEQKAIAMVDKLFQKAKNAKKSYDEKWLENYRMFRGKQWKENRPSYRHSEVLNLIFRAIQSEIPILTDALPRPEFIPQEPNDFELSKILNDVLDSDWTRNNWSYNFTEILYDSHIYGVGFGSLLWDSEAEDGMGGLSFKSADPFYQFPDPYSKNVNEESRYYIEAEPKDIEVLKQKYPEQAQFLKPDVIDINKKDKNISDQVKYKSATDLRTVIEGTSPYDVESKNEALEVCCYVKDMESVEEETKEMGEDGIEKTMYIKKLKYPEGRKLVLVNGILVENAVNEYDDRKYPYIRLTNYILPREFWGISEIEQLESPQKIFNKLISFTLDVLTLMGNPIWVVGNTSGVDTDNLFNRPGMIVEADDISQVQRQEGVQLQPFVLQMIDRIKGYFDDISGSNDSSRGVRPEGVTAASAIEALQDAAQTRLRQKTRNIDAFMQEFGQMYLSRVFQYYNAPRIFRITDNQNATKYFKFHVDIKDELDPMGMPTGNKVKVAKVRQFEQGTDGKHYPGQEKEFDVRQKFDVKIATGSALPFEKSRVEQQTLSLFDRGIIDAEEVMKNIRYPNAESVMKRMAEKAAQQAAMNPQQQQQQPPQQ